jgi:respiratory nitrate reductase gamma subunit
MIAAEYLNNFFLGYLPYVALTVLATGLIYRTIRRNNTIQASSSQFISNDKSLRWGSTLFHYAILLVLLGHILGLLTPEWLYNWFMTNETKRLLAILMGSISGAAASAITTSGLNFTTAFNTLASYSNTIASYSATSACSSQLNIISIHMKKHLLPF